MTTPWHLELTIQYYILALIASIVFCIVLVLDTVVRGGMMNAMLSFVLCCLGFGLLFILIEVTSRLAGNRLSGDDTRKAVHILAGLMAAALPFVLTFPQITALGLFFIGFMAVSKATHLFPSIHGVTRMTLGEVYYPLAIAIVAWRFPVAIIYTYAILVLAIADGFAAVVGIRFGRHQYTGLGGQKSYQGSAVCWATSFVLTVATLLLMGMSTTTVLGASMLGASMLTLTEASFGGGLDNLVLPLLAAIILSILD